MAQKGPEKPSQPEFHLPQPAVLNPPSRSARILHMAVKMFMAGRKRLQVRFGTYNPTAKPEPYQLRSFPQRGYFAVTEVKLPQSRGFYLYPTDATGPHRVVLQLHGGSYISPFSHMYAKAAYQYAQAAETKNGAAAVFSLDYRTAPEHPYPAALEDALDAYDWLLTQGYAPDQIILAGDSAGGGLALALALKLRDQGVPNCARALVLLSPWTDLPAKGTSYQANKYRDPLFQSVPGVPDPEPIAKYYVGDADPYDPYLSPAYAQLHDLPPTLALVGQTELLYSDSVKVIRGLQDAGVKARLQVYPEVIHVWPAAFTRLPESQRAWQQISYFLHEN
ncbi:hypothetical protein BSR28_03145 [Boudabousia liubingyangii]|uniref:alpha/beta hydrolase fold domain-containing protein n=1 Tax=Boudabousia liubingyangii TaxID=1921764 RepID=UPI0009394393|nr:alpha/beta hydrolase fold domain-containing protein [Boudabousia liubingyangii]OKL47509.1 hypothetical protein BSR28_03145 [Boudabousia liubingyangii]